ncbi:MAG: threonylcarbamoyl-AMP synthase [Clostridia bacterium]|nr:threonylcarbamoyl-AMP synthase [Clostridia bacterium]
MQTELLTPTGEHIAQAAALIRDGQLVAFPTETVYGLGANALDADAVRAIFAAKGRPADNPLIMHICDPAQLDGLVTVPGRAQSLMDAFWPGPLTILMPRTDRVPDVVTAGLSTVAVRYPSHPVARALLAVSRVPVAAPSANRSGRPSPTTAAHVLEDMNGRIPMILDGGPCEVGLESTVLDLSGDVPCILRPGGVTKGMLEELLGPVEVAPSVLKPLAEGEVARSPGMRYRHYAPKGSITLVSGAEEDVLRAMRRLWQNASRGGQRACVLCFREHTDALRDCRPHDLGSMRDPSETAERLFDTLRRLDAEGMDIIYSEVLPAEGIGLAVMNRLGRAASFRTVRAADVLSDNSGSV